jgi:phenylalanyl-tRNA synthetase alpha chain
MGVTVPVIAWGLGLDRMAMVAMGLHDIRDLFASDLEFLRTLRPPSPSTEPGTGA